MSNTFLVGTVIAVSDATPAAAEIEEGDNLLCTYKVGIKGNTLVEAKRGYCERTPMHFTDTICNMGAFTREVTAVQDQTGQMIKFEFELSKQNPLKTRTVFKCDALFPADSVLGEVYEAWIPLRLPKDDPIPVALPIVSAKKGQEAKRRGTIAGPPSDVIALKVRMCTFSIQWIYNMQAGHQREIDEASGRETTLEGKLEGALDDWKKLQENLDATRSSLEAANTLEQKTQAIFATYQQEHQITEDADQTKISDLKNQILIEEGKEEELEISLKTMTHNFGESTQQKADLKAAMEVRIASLKSELELKAKRQQEATAKMDALQLHFDAELQKEADLRIEKANLEKQLQDEEAAEAVLKAKLSNLYADLDAVRAQGNAAEDASNERIAGLEGQLRAKQIEEDGLLERLTDLQRLFDETMDKANAQAAALQQQLVEERRHAAGLGNQLEQLKLRLNNLQLSYAASMERLQAEFLQFRVTAADTQAHLEDEKAYQGRRLREAEERRKREIGTVAEMAALRSLVAKCQHRITELQRLLQARASDFDRAAADAAIVRQLPVSPEHSPRPKSPASKPPPPVSDIKKLYERLDVRSPYPGSPQIEKTPVDWGDFATAPPLWRQAQIKAERLEQKQPQSEWDRVRQTELPRRKAEPLGPASQPPPPPQGPLHAISLVSPKRNQHIATTLGSPQPKYSNATIGALNVFDHSPGNVGSAAVSLQLIPGRIDRL